MKARQQMMNNSICQDVFIAKNGNKDEKEEAWITNFIILEQSELFLKKQEPEHCLVQKSLKPNL